jgi:hypothetical protein
VLSKRDARARDGKPKSDVKKRETPLIDGEMNVEKASSPFSPNRLLTIDCRGCFNGDSSKCVEQVMIFKTAPRWLVACVVCVLSVVVDAESLGNLAQYPPTPAQLTIITSNEGYPVIEPSIIELDSGNYYRLTVSCPDVKSDLSGWRVEMPQLLNNSHLRLVAVGDIEIHLQGLSFNAIECDEIGSASVSFVPIKPGNYPLYVGNVPLSLGRPMGEAGVQAAGKYVISEIKVQ